MTMTSLGTGVRDLLARLLDRHGRELVLDDRRQLCWEADGVEQKVSEVTPVDGEDVREVGSLDRPRVPFGHPRLEGVHPYRHAHATDLSDVALMDQVTGVAGAWGETALQPDDVSDAFGLSQRQEFFRLGGAGGERPFAVHVLPSFDGCSGEPGVFGAGGEDHHEVDIGIGDEVVMVVERVRDVELRGEAFGGLLGAAAHRDDLEGVQSSQGGDVAVLRPTTGSDDADASLSTHHDRSLSVRCA
jgi:hypothetical protein